MTRVRVDKNGIAIAKAGYDVDTAPLNKMNFSPLFSAMQVALKGSLTVAGYSGYLSTRYKMASLTFPTAFAKPPIVMVAGQNADGSTDQTAWAYSFTGTSQAWYLPVYQTITTTTGFELYVLASPPDTDYGGNADRTLTWRYWVFRNTLED